MALTRSRSLVLQAFPYSDSSKILRLFCLEHGLRSVIAKGAQRPRSRYGGVLEPFTEGEAIFHLREGRDLHTLSAFELIRSRQALGRDLAAFAGASLIAELILRAGTEEAHPALYHAAVTAFDRLAAAENDAAAAALAGVWRVVALLGFHPEMRGCVHCGRELGPDESSRVDVEAGGAACLRCRTTGRVVDARTRAEVRAMCSPAAVDAEPGDRALHRALLRAFLSTHLASGQPLRSLDLFAAQMAERSGA